MLATRLRPFDATLEDPEEIFTSFLPHLFPDDTPFQHGEPGGYLLYTSPRYGDMKLKVPENPDAAESRRLFAHYLWTSSVLVAEGMEDEIADREAMVGEGYGGGDERGLWTVKGQKILELGAGVALPSLIAAMSGAAQVTITDHPASPALTSGTIQENVKSLIPEAQQSNVTVVPHEWGVLDTPFALENKHAFTRLIVADCLWMRWVHEQLLDTIDWFLGEGEDSWAWVVAGFHTGREIVADFYETAEKRGFMVEKLWERDLGSEDRILREWTPKRMGESLENRRRWCTVGILKRRKVA